MKTKLTLLLAAAMILALPACSSSGSSGSEDGDREVLRVAMSADYAPFDWIQEDDSNGAVLTTNGSYMNGYDVLDQVTDFATKSTALDTFAAMVSAVNAGTIDGFTCDYPSAMSLQITNDNLVILDFSDGTGFEVSSEETDLGIACQMGSDLVEKINTVLAELSQEDRDAMMEQAVAAQPASALS